MSGGVDSSLAAALLKEKGYQVMGLTMQVLPSLALDSHFSAHFYGGIQASQQVANQLEIPLTILHLQKEFEEKVISYFCAEYREARTPNPCMVCNRELKFHLLLQKARDLGGDFLATGHYARIIQGKKGRYLIKRGLDGVKDQSYFLYHLTQEQLGSILMPLGSLQKKRVRDLAQAFSLPVHDRPESQEICFIPNQDYRSFLRERDATLEQEGPILDEEGRQVGTHQGLAFYTIGQRRGLGISTRKPKYVVAMDKRHNALIIGDNADTYDAGLVAENVNWVAFDRTPDEMEVLAQIRYTSGACKAWIVPQGEGRVSVLFQEKQRAVTPGQSVVFYQGDLLLGGGVIQERIRGSL